MAIPAATGMRSGGHLSPSEQVLDAVLLSANAGITPFPATRWHTSQWNCWVLDLTHNEQRQRIEDGPEFLRAGGTASLYRPRLRYHEWQIEGEAHHESWALFTLRGELERVFLDLTGRTGFCHFCDPDHLLTRRLQRISELLFHRRPGFALLAQAAFLDLLGQLSTAQQSGPDLREAREMWAAAPGADHLPGRVERFIRVHIAEPLRVGDLARHVGLSVSAFAHAYPKLAGEPPYRTIVRLKIEAAKRLLVDESLTVKETASRLGYSTEFQFSRAFKRFEGTAPTPYVRAMNVKHAAP
jgi:AraC-like DNA-binding protein